ncbi:hypothetical protein HMPREF0970_01808 [Schaalia odontolytica F0309]|uniref:Uncharacterized protein n=1 Tax=Schaalia odontolytica F0309 TaxID=649742 RepID=D4U0R5_9ACTO|nr:hypothetical protein HMPREF0970_01808 [Schaalia odontolytica F0309]
MPLTRLATPKPLNFLTRYFLHQINNCGRHMLDARAAQAIGEH